MGKIVQEKHLNFEADEQKYVKSMRSLGEFIEAVKGRTILETVYFLIWYLRFLRSNKLEKSKCYYWNK